MNAQCQSTGVGMFCRCFDAGKARFFEAVKTLARGEVASDKIVDGHDGGSGLELLERSRWPALPADRSHRLWFQICRGESTKIAMLFYSA